jgi:acyl-CoA dehydrogenase
MVERVEEVPLQEMPLPDYLAWPFFESYHQEIAKSVRYWASTALCQLHSDDTDAVCRDLVRQLGQANWLCYSVAGLDYGGFSERIDTRTVCLIRETLARYSGLADFSFAMQGLGAGAISLFGTKAQRANYLPMVAKGQSIAAFALSEPEAGSDVGGMVCEASFVGEHYVLNGEKTWISNGGIADFYVVFARTGEPGTKGISAFIVDANNPGLSVTERIQVMAPHPLAKLKFTHCRIHKSQRIGEVGHGFKIAMATLDVFRTSVAAAALGFARRAMDEALLHVKQRQMFGKKLADFQLTQARLADMATGIDAAALLTYRAAWLRDQGQKVTKEAAMAKMTATETAQKVIDSALQLFGGLGVVSEMPVERLYREIRALRIYEGATEVQQMIIAREILNEPGTN